jgi:hypothetical protein
MTDFTHAGYLNLLKFIRDLGRPAVSFRDIPAEGGYVILRHDIDFSLRCAVKMAQLDKEAGATSTFFVLLTTPYYNPLSEDGVRAIREIVGLGHECGLHYDCTGFELLSPERRLKRIDVLARTLEDVSGAPIRAIAQHKPARSPIRQEFPSYLDAYAAPYFKDIAYISDSRMMFRVPDVGEFLRQNPRSQVLIHPAWWRAKRMARSTIFVALKNEIAAAAEAMLRFEDESISRALATRAIS